MRDLRDENCWILNQINIIGNLPINYRELTEGFANFLKIFSGNVLCLILTTLSNISCCFSENFPITLWWLYNKALLNQLFVPHGKYPYLSLCTDVISFGLYVITAVGIFCHMLDLTIG